ncbi:MAG: response regulator receiver protein [Deltaproteobacteria bacterium]|jgi:CheY-like chemotaxis protein|nr:response regulator receiver protein [Deltaproteobacteria bacterium]MBP2682173.1 response regulator receiver protein [Deltaproteobacteria bacterium]
MVPKKVLVVDDDNLIGWALHKELTTKGMNVSIATTGEELLAAIREIPFDLVFLDIHLPDANGIDLLNIIRDISPETRVVIISGDGNSQGKERALSCGAVQFLEKPFDIGVVAKIMESTFLEFSCKRKHWRYLCDIPLRLSVLAPSREEDQFDLESLSVRAKDVAREGVRVKTEYPLKEGQGVRLRIADEGDPFSRMIPREASAEVVWAVPGNGMSIAGLRFVTETPRSA